MAGLSAIERQVLAGVAFGETADETARRLIRALATIKHHRRAVLAKLGARNAAHAVAIAYETGVLGPQPADTPISERQLVAVQARTGELAKLQGVERREVRHAALARVAAKFAREIAEVGDLTGTEASWLLDLLDDVRAGDAEL